jgi:DNA polymerase lambda
VGLFAGVWGAGAETTKQWFAQGFRTLDDLRTRARLTRMQQIGLQYYDEFNSRIPREEVTRLESMVKQAANEVAPDLMIETYGSYRRLKSSCGDIDMLMTFKDGRKHTHDIVLARLVDKLKEIGKEIFQSVQHRTVTMINMSRISHS